MLEQVPGSVQTLNAAQSLTAPKREMPVLAEAAAPVPEASAEALVLAPAPGTATTVALLLAFAPVADPALGTGEAAAVIRLR